jgi:hypothetical protein
MTVPVYNFPSYFHDRKVDHKAPDINLSLGLKLVEIYRYEANLWPCYWLSYFCRSAAKTRSKLKGINSFVTVSDVIFSTHGITSMKKSTWVIPARHRCIWECGGDILYTSHFYERYPEKRDLIQYLFMWKHDILPEPRSRKVLLHYESNSGQWIPTNRLCNIQTKYDIKLHKSCLNPIQNEVMMVTV